MYTPEHAFECFEVVLECFFTCFGDGIRGIRFAADESFVNLYKAILFEVGQMGGKVPVSEFEHLFEIVKADLFVHQQDAHHPHPDATIEYFI